MGDWITIWTIRVALALFVLGIACELSGFRRRWYRLWRWAWAIGFAFMLGHVAAAFHFFHHWSHREAYQSTAEQTQALLGFSFGAGVYFNYLFVAVWGADLLLAWSIDDRQRTLLPKAIGLRAIGLAFLVFIAFNSTVVFGTGMVRWLGIVATGLLLGVLVGRSRL